MDTYVFANQKGGVGKTTVTLGVAAELAARGVRDAEDRCSMADVMLEPNRYAFADSITASEWGFDVEPSETALASRESRRATADEFVLRRQLEGLSAYDVALVDCPPSLGLLTLNSLTAASHLVVVTEPSFLALQDIDELLETRELQPRARSAARVVAPSPAHALEKRGRCMPCAEYHRPSDGAQSVVHAAHDGDSQARNIAKHRLCSSDLGTPHLMLGQQRNSFLDGRALPGTGCPPRRLLRSRE